MKRAFTARDAKRIARDYQGRLENLRLIGNLGEQGRTRIIQCADTYLTDEMENLWKDIPIDEINRDKLGISVRALRQMGFTTIADLTGVTKEQLISVKGIGEESAQNILRVFDAIQNQTKRMVKIQLSVDHQTVNASNLVLAITQYKLISPISLSCQDLLDQVGIRIQDSLEDIKSASSMVRWLFTSGMQKQRSVEAYAYLESLSQGSFETIYRQMADSAQMIQNISVKDAWNAFEKNPIEYYTLLERLMPGILDTEESRYGLPEQLAEAVEQQERKEEGLLCTLRRYQEWGVKYILHQKRVLLGDEMGLGKTVQAIAAMVSLQNAGEDHFIVICPASVLSNWSREIKKHSTLGCITVHGATRLAAIHQWKKQGGVAVTTYETTPFFDLEEDFRYSMCVVDEAHYIKNPQAQRTINTVRLCEKAERLLFMTGTSIENHVDEMVSLIRILQPEIADRVKELTFMANAPEFREQIAPVYYRRKRQDVMSELPELIESREWCVLDETERSIYHQSLRSGNIMEIRRVSWNVPDLAHSSKARRLMELVTAAREDGRKVLIFSYFLEVVEKVSHLLGDVCSGTITGAVSGAERQEIIDRFQAAEDGKALVAQITSGGTGLNIQAASVVILCEPQLKPSTEHQAIARAYRMGQARTVLVYRLLCDDTIDERLLERLVEKQRVFDAFADESEAAKEEKGIDNGQLQKLVQEELERIGE